MCGRRLPVFLAAVVLACLVEGLGAAEDGRLGQIEQRLRALERGEKQVPGFVTFVLPGFYLLVLATFCALWARSTARDPWLWFVAGLLFNLFALVAILYIAGDEKKSKKITEPLAVADWPPEGGNSSQNIKPA